jgi:predicted SAM-dependent methyltransferase
MPHTQKARPLKLNLGCGKHTLKGYVNIDIVKTTPETTVANIMNLPFYYKSYSVSEIYLRHVIEHFYEDEIKMLLKDFHWILKPKGKLVIETVDFKLIMKGWQEGKLSKELLNEFLFGFYAHERTREREAYMLHKYTFDYYLLAKFLVEAGFNNIKYYSPGKPFNYDKKYGDFFTGMKVVAIK